jgi:hypothetical protein
MGILTLDVDAKSSDAAGFVKDLSAGAENSVAELCSEDVGRALEDLNGPR